MINVELLCRSINSIHFYFALFALNLDKYLHHTVRIMMASGNILVLDSQAPF
jgi:hypothetical protein